MADVKELNINNTTYDIKAKTVVDQNGGSVKVWTGTKAEFDAIATKDPYTLYNVTGVETNVNQIITELANKTNINFDNVTDEAKVLMSSMGMPSNKYISLTLGASGTRYTAPTDGWFVLRYNITTSGGWATLGLGSMTIGGVGNYWTGTQNGLLLPVKKNDIITVNYAGATNAYFRFVYAQGSESEAN